MQSSYYNNHYTHLANKLSTCWQFDVCTNIIKLTIAAFLCAVEPEIIIVSGVTLGSMLLQVYHNANNERYPKGHDIAQSWSMYYIGHVSL